MVVTFFVLASAMLAGCATPMLTKGEADPKTPFKALQVFFGTDRQDTRKAEPYLRFSNERGAGIIYGTCVVTIPASHRTGELEGPSSLLPSVLYRVMENPSRHVVLNRVSVLARQDFLRTVRDAPGRKALVFVHGYNSTFEDAARRTAQIVSDAEFDGMAMFYSWPSKASFKDYPDDEDTIELSHIYLRAFLRDLAMESNFDAIYLIAHSMGNRALTRAFIDLKADIPPAKLAVFKEIILAAPDIGAEVFRKAIAPALADTPGRFTLYASSNDKALQISKDFHGYPRLGETHGGLVIASGIESIDASSVGTELYWNLGHSYVGDSPEILQDLHYLLVKQLGASKRYGLEPVVTQSGRYWRFKPKK
jgi:esterase/lipase superfamily enzyme